MDLVGLYFIFHSWCDLWEAIYLTDTCSHGFRMYTSQVDDVSSCPEGIIYLFFCDFSKEILYSI